MRMLLLLLLPLLHQQQMLLRLLLLLLTWHWPAGRGLRGLAHEVADGVLVDYTRMREKGERIWAI